MYPRHQYRIDGLISSSSQYAQPITKKGKTQAPAADASAEPKKLSNHAQRNLDEKKKGHSSFPCHFSEY
jgi:hypothetical protein